MELKNIWIPVLVAAFGSAFSVAAQVYLGKGWMGVLFMSLAALCTTVVQELKSTRTTSAKIKKTKIFFP